MLTTVRRGSKNFSSEMFQRPEIPGNTPHLFPAPNFVIPSARTVASMLYFDPKL